MSGIDWRPVILSMEVALCSLVLVSILGIAIAHAMRKYDFPGKMIAEALFTMPLVLPPVVTGFFLLVIIGKNGPIGILLERYLDTQVVFTPYAAVLAGTVVAFPLMYQSVKASFQSIDTNLEDAARTLGAREVRIFFTITIPLAWPGILAGMVLSFSRALGEFGATIMVAGSIPGKTQTIPLAIYFAADSNDMTVAGIYVTLISLLTFGMILMLNFWNKKKEKLFVGKEKPCSVSK